MKRKHTLVVGGTRGLGAEFVRFFRKQGHSVSSVSRNAPAKAADKNVFYATADVGDAAQFRLALWKCVEKFGPLDTLILTQRFRGENPWDGEFAVTLGGTKTAVDTLRDQFSPSGSKSIVVISSVAGQYFIDDQPVAYHMSKAALDHMIRFYAVELGPKGIRVNGVAPCAFVKRESREYYANNKEFKTIYKNVAPLKRMVTTEDITRVAGALSDPGFYATGQIITMDAGLSLLWPEAAIKRR